MARTRLGAARRVGTGAGRSFFLLLVWLVVPFLIGSPTSGRAAVSAGLVVRDGVPGVKASLLLRREDPATVRAGVLFDLAPGWHVYWRSSGETGLPPDLTWEAPGARIGEIQWPAPIAFAPASATDGLPSYGYEDRVLLASDLAFAAGAPDGTRVAVDGDVLVCETECVPAVFRLERDLGEQHPGLDAAAERELFDRFAARVPVRPEALGAHVSVGYSQSAIRPGDRFEAALSVSTPEGRVVSFFPDDLEALELRVVEVGPQQDGWLVSVEGLADPGEPLELDRLTGVLQLEGADGGLLAAEVDVPFPAAPAEARISQLGRHWLPPNRADGGVSLLRALLLALLGGLVLNLMPCVLPVLAIKVFGLSQMAEAARDGRGELLRHGAAYTLGIVGSMAVLAGCVVALRSAGHAVGWGFQFQEPIYVAGISAVLVAFAANLFGVYEIPAAGTSVLADVGREATGARRSFFEGLLAVALATPCSAPFLGTAVGFAFASEPAVIFAIFGAVGVGLAAPFALVTLVPAWARFVPRSGPWMQGVRAGLGFALLATVVWLLWIFGASTGTPGVVALLAFLVTLAFCLWLFGLLQGTAHPRTTVAAGLLVIGFGVGGLNAVATRTGAVTPEPGRAAADRTGWETWSPDAVRETLARGTPVFVRFTADWCITCKLNERVVLAHEGVETALAAGGYRLFVADWTQRDEAIRRELSRFGRAGVPLYLVYDPDRPDDPALLPELLSLEGTLAALGEPRHPQTPKPGRSARR